MSLDIYITNPRYNPGIPSKSSVQPIEPVQSNPSKLPRKEPSKKPTKNKQKQS